ncbi:MAG: threonine/homoserine/homoserine lactone efflux protein [Maricaulis maris]|jgi:threonine/homoserine/homoserine lactone efflux protein|uniref:Lysine exporter protein (LYSE/YGGA) n=1 Tax=Maricaulis maris (strain MCS10) TaxID=394221 RepID=Q0AKC0_MARMM|nr:LysE family translocator [Maricaulis maris]ABI67273.1 Lysine exporter protein (LYSE/YGGA) [Maricaulis maris MCS10]
MTAALDPVFTFALTVLLLELTPGPNMAWLAVLSADRGRRAGFSAVLGVMAGLLCIGLLAAIGLAALVERTPWLFGMMRYGGMLFLLWLALEGWRSSGESSPARSGNHLSRHFRHGLMINLLNPKAGLFYLIVLPEFLQPDLPLLPQAVGLTILSVAIATAIHLIIVLLAARAAGWLKNPARTLHVRRALAILLAVIAIWLFIDSAPS